MLEEGVHTMKENVEPLVVSSKEIGLEMLFNRTTLSGLQIRMQEKATV
jgi:hypothetical protein